MKYLTAGELKGVIKLLEVLNSSDLDGISVGNIPLIDATGEVCGTVGFSDGGMYALLLSELRLDDDE